MPSLLGAEALRLRATLFQVEHPKAVPLPVGPASLRGGGSPDPSRDAGCGYEALGGLIVRVDAVESLLGAAHAQARKGPFHTSPSLARLLQCATEALPAVLLALGFEKTEHGFRAREPRKGPRLPTA